MLTAPASSARACTRSLAGIWEGWSKNNFLMFGRNVLMMLAAVISVYFVAVSPFVLASPCRWPGSSSATACSTRCWSTCWRSPCCWRIRWRARSYFGTPLRYYLWHPLGGLVFIAIMLNSAYRTSGGRGGNMEGAEVSGDADPGPDLSSAAPV